MSRLIEDVNVSEPLHEDRSANSRGRKLLSMIKGSNPSEYSGFYPEPDSGSESSEVIMEGGIDYPDPSTVSKPRFISSEPLKMATRGSAGADISAKITTPHGSIIIPPRGSVIVDTGISINIPPGYYAQLCPRSGLGFRYQVVSFNGVIDSDYKDEIKILLTSHSDRAYTINHGDRIAQLVLLKHYVFDDVIYLSDSTQHTGFGSSGRA